MSERNKLYRAYKKLSTPFKKNPEVHFTDRKPVDEYHLYSDEEDLTYEVERIFDSGTSRTESIGQGPRIEELRHPVFKYFYHATHCSNLHYVLERGLMSRRNLKKDDLFGQIKTNSNSEIVERRNNTGLNANSLIPNLGLSIEGRISLSSFVPLYLIPDSPTMWHFMQDPEYCILAIDISILKDENLHFVFSDGNLASKETSIIDSLEKLNLIDFVALMPTFEKIKDKTFQEMLLNNVSRSHAIDAFKKSTFQEWGKYKGLPRPKLKPLIKKEYTFHDLRRIRNAELLVYCKGQNPVVPTKYIDHIYMNHPKDSKFAMKYANAFFGSEPLWWKGDGENGLDYGEMIKAAGMETAFDFSFKNETPLHLKRSCPYNSIWTSDHKTPLGSNTHHIDQYAFWIHTHLVDKIP